MKKIGKRPSQDAAGKTPGKPAAVRYGVISGSGIFGLDEYDTTEHSVETAYGRVILDVVDYHGTAIAFLSRHGKYEAKPPHQINYRANISALSQMGVQFIFASGAAGSCQPAFKPGDAVIIDDFVDFTKNRDESFFQDGCTVCHASMREPYCRHLQEQFTAKAKKLNLTIAGTGTYVCTEGPRFETRAEIGFFRKMGWEMVGMTSVPEVLLAKEKGICYCAIAMITNWATGMEDQPVTPDSLDVISTLKHRLNQIFLAIFTEDSLTQEGCSCKHSLLYL